MRLRTIKSCDAYLSDIAIEIKSLKEAIATLQPGQQKDDVIQQLNSRVAFKESVEADRERIVAGRIARKLPIPEYDQVIQAAHRYIEVGIEPRSALKQAAREAGIEFGKRMEQFTTYAEARIS